MSTHTPQTKRGFTLVEILIVVIILGILAAIVIPQFASAASDAAASAAASATRAVQAQVDAHGVSEGSYPGAIQASWFVGNTMPENPYDPDNAVGVQTCATGDTTELHPKFKHIADIGCFWYNPANGCFRLLVAWQGDNAETLALYNQVNSSALTHWCQTARE